MAAPVAPHASDLASRSEILKVAAASLIGTSIEWYDFFLYGTAAALVFNKLFFPTFAPLTGTMAAFATYAVGFAARPIGGIVFGHYGDKLGRKTMLYLTLLIMGVATTAIGLLPTYATIGIWAPILLVAMRLLQGLGIGGEWGGAVLMAIEHAPAHRRGFYGSWPQMGVAIGLLLSTLVFRHFSGYPEATFLAWGWRVPFLLSFILLAVGLWIRHRLAESPVFARLKSRKGEARMPVIEVFRRYMKPMLLATGARLAENGLFYIFTTFSLTYVATQLKLDRNMALNGLLVASACSLFTVPAWGALSDRLGRRPVYLWGAVAGGILAFPFFWLLETGRPAPIWLAFVLAITLGHDAMYAPQASFFAELFPTRVRYSGASLASQLGSVFSGGLSPLIATALLARSGGKSWPVSVYMVALVLITVVSVWLTRETHRQAIDD
ncbi:MAG: MFS transporter [Gemmatimonadetes bacterium]|nr:MAG: MFS transporter [Gemmatimonadota bacterium]